MDWAGITLNGRTDLHVYERGIVNAVRYRDEVLEPYFHLFTGAVGCDFILMDDNAMPIGFIWSKNFWKVRIFTKCIVHVRHTIIRVEHTRNALGYNLQTSENHLRQCFSKFEYSRPNIQS
ncbi:transposable element Tc1 transposase [Trichonephila clavipes]|nr:transposable element Tc1 transposase [Trichonephila clavipes]